MTKLMITTLASAIALAACGSPSQGPGKGLVPQSATAGRPGHRASGSYGELVYVVTGKAVVMMSYPQGNIVGSIPWHFSGHSSGLSVCSDPNNGNVFIPEGAAIYEYAHGGTTPIATLSVPSGHDALGGCSVDPITGNLAQVTGDVLIYPKAQGTPAIYSYKNAAFTYPAYDDSGNLFLGGGVGKGKFKYSRIAEIRSGKTRFTFINVTNNIGLPQKIQWDGTYLTVKNYAPSSNQKAIEQIQISGKTGTVVNSVPLASSVESPYFWIQDGSVFALLGHLRHDNWGIAAWRYPSGGSPRKALYGLKDPEGIGDITVSVAPSH